MSAYSGNVPKNRKEHRANKRREAEARNKVANAAPRECGHIHGVSTASRCGAQS